MMIEFKYALPLLLMSFFSITSIVFDAIINRKSFSYFYSIFSLIIVSISLFYNLSLPAFSTNFKNISEMTFPITNGMVNFNGYSYFFDLVFILAGLLTLLASKSYLDREKYNYNEFYSLILLSISGMMIIVHSKNLLVLFVGIEIMSVIFYVLTGFFRKNIFSIEAAVKYFLLGAFATGFLLYGIALVYGSTGALDYNIIEKTIRIGKATNIYLIIGIAMMLIGLSFKAAAFPFHMWAPDVYQGAPTVISGFMSTAGKSASVIAFLIVLKILLPVTPLNGLLMENDVITPQLEKNSEIIKQILAYISALTMLYGNIVALVQKNVKRMLSYSSIAHAGYLMIGLVGLNNESWTAIGFYSLSYTLMQIGAFVVLSMIERNNEDNLNIEDFSGLFKTNPYLSALFSMFMLSLAGIPPFAGFFGKYYLFISAVKADFTWLAIIGAISSIISMYFYIGLIIKIYFSEQGQKVLEPTNSKLSLFAITISWVALLVFGMFPNLITNLLDNLM